MNKIKIYTSPLLKEELDLFETFYDKEKFYILMTKQSYTEPISKIFNNTRKFVLCWSPINNIFKKNEQYYFWKLLKKSDCENSVTPVDYSIYEKYL